MSAATNESVNAANVFQCERDLFSCCFPQQDPETQDLIIKVTNTVAENHSGAKPSTGLSRACESPVRVTALCRLGVSS